MRPHANKCTRKPRAGQYMKYSGENEQQIAEFADVTTERVGERTTNLPRTQIRYDVRLLRRIVCD